jgi:alcohol dehydrogenase (NADP+)
LLGLGTWKSEVGLVRSSVYAAIKIGYRHIDAAWVYNNQGEVGEGIQQALAEGIVKREDLWVTSKLWNNCHRKEDVERQLRETLEQLKLDYLDLYLIHWPLTDVEAETLTPPYQETWQAMEDMLGKGLTKTIGVSNMTVKKLTAMKEYATVWPAVNQVEMHPMLRQDELLAACTAMGTHVTAYSPLGSPDSASFIKHDGASLLAHPVVQKLAQETGKSAGQVLIRWALQHGSSVIPKSVTPSRIQENFEMDGWSLSDAQFAELSALPVQQRMIEGRSFLKPGGPYRTLEEFWDL